MTNSKSATSLSVALRAPELNRRLSLTESFFGDLVDAFDSTRKIRSFCKQLPAHAMIALTKKGQTSKFVSVVRRILYRDSRQQHADLSGAAKTLRRSRQQEEKLAKPFRPEVTQVSEEKIFANLVASFMQERCTEEPASVFSVGEWFFNPLILRPAAIRRPKHAPVIQADVQHGDILVANLQKETASDGSPLVGCVQSADPFKLNLERKIQENGLSAFLSAFKSWQRHLSRHVALPLPDGANADV